MKIYTKKNENINHSLEDLDSYLQNIDHPVVKEADKNICEEEITIEELGKALQGMNNNSAPGISGITTPFYKLS